MNPADFFPLSPEWKNILAPELASPQYATLVDKLQHEYEANRALPCRNDVFAALNAVKPDDVKVVIIGQDPYHGPGQANGLAFSVNSGLPLPPSLKNIFKEIASEQNTTIITDGNLEPWASQGVLLLNTALTVEPSKPASHSSWGWQQITDAVISHISSQNNNVVFLLWGKHAQSKSKLIDSSKHLILQSPHPSPLSASKGFFGHGHFQTANQYLSLQGKNTVKW